MKNLLTSFLCLILLFTVFLLLPPSLTFCSTTWSNSNFQFHRIKFLGKKKYEHTAEKTKKKCMKKISLILLYLYTNFCFFSLRRLKEGTEQERGRIYKRNYENNINWVNKALKRYLVSGFPSLFIALAELCRLQREEYYFAKYILNCFLSSQAAPTRSREYALMKFPVLAGCNIEQSSGFWCLVCALCWI